MTDTCASSAPDDRDPDRYEDFLTGVRNNFDENAGSDGILFTTDASDLWDTFLSNIPEGRRQHYTCRTCQRFVETCGGLVLLGGGSTAAGSATPLSAMWDHTTAPPFFQAAVIALARAVHRARVTGVYLDANGTWGTASSDTTKAAGGTFYHLSVTPPERLRFKVNPLLTAEQATAAKRKEYGMLCRGLEEYPIDVVRQAHALLTSGNLYRSEKCVGVAKWLLDLQEELLAVWSRSARADNVKWLAAARAPVGFCHVRSGVIGALLDDVKSGLPFESIKRRFNEKLDPLVYQRPQAQPSAGNVVEAERVVGALASVGALARRFARLDDVQALWRPKPAEPPVLKGGVFANVRTRGHAAHTPSPIEQPVVTMTWEKFARVALPEAERVELYLPPLRALSYAALITAANPEAPPIVQWDRTERRNAVTWYVYSNGSTPPDWGVAPGWCPVVAFALQPSMWDPEVSHAHQGASVFAILEGARDARKRVDPRGGGLFPEHLRSEYHGVRATLEAYAQTAEVTGWEDSSACGLKMDKGRAWDHLFHVTARGVQQTYKLDRWDCSTKPCSSSCPPNPKCSPACAAPYKCLSFGCGIPAEAGGLCDGKKRPPGEATYEDPGEPDPEDP